MLRPLSQGDLAGPHPRPPPPRLLALASLWVRHEDPAAGAAAGSAADRAGGLGRRLLLFIPWVVQAQEVTPTRDATGVDPPAQPTNLRASAEHDAVTLTWAASTDQAVTHYTILRRNPDTDALGVFHVIEGNAGPETSYTDQSVAAASGYNYRVKAVSPTGVSQWSGFVKADTPAAPDPTPTLTSTPTPEPPLAPADQAPTNLTADIVDGGIALSWTAPVEDADSVTGYEILRRRPNRDETTLATLVADTNSSDTTYTDSTANEAGGGVRLPGQGAAGERGEPVVQLRPHRTAVGLRGVPGGRAGHGYDAERPLISTDMIVTSVSINLSWLEPDDDGGSAVTGYKVEYS